MADERIKGKGCVAQDRQPRVLPQVFALMLRWPMKDPGLYQSNIE